MNEPSEVSLPAGVIDALRAALPSAAPSRATIAGRGWDVIAWRVPASGGDWLVRVPRVADAMPTVEAQYRLGVALEGSALPLPREPRLLRGADGRVVAGLYRYVDGETAHVSGRAARARLATSIAAFLSTLHAIDPELGVRCGATPTVLWRDAYAPMIERCAPALPPKTGAWVRAIGTRLEQASRTMPPLTLVHADLKPAHVLVDGNQRIVAVLDFEGAQVTDPARDFSRLIQNWDMPFASLVLREYLGAVDEGFMVRAECYREFDALEGLDLALRRDWPDWLARSRRALGLRAAAAARRG
ncbi:MAG: aminoglycoside phosphotransferase family protein [Dehalococcoidia bacterium]|nr:MAG: aminoglycoside phosphotransferase family protein [Dehalococcoidia bacterium]